MENQAGFTLIELMTVVAVVGILAVLAIPTYRVYVGRAQVSEAFSLIGGLKPSLAEYMARHSGCPDNSQTSVGNIPKAKYISGTYVDNILVSAVKGKSTECAFTATFKSSGVLSALSNRSMRLTAVVSGGSYSWTCSSKDIANKYLPSYCSGAN